MALFMSAKKRKKKQTGEKNLRTGDFGICFDLEFKTSQACVEVGQSSSAPELTFSDPDACQHLRTG